mmetsp:Transcript_10644/g.39735  ORF Transcript_10644/g.39735 Transcript_10644/m.39735 type:complete len:103 (+) Transcript_10644:1259-1567(+)
MSSSSPPSQYTSQEFDHNDLPEPFIAPHDSSRISASSTTFNSKCPQFQSILQQCILDKGSFSACFEQYDVYQKCVQREREIREREEWNQRFDAFMQEEKEKK